MADRQNEREEEGAKLALYSLSFFLVKLEIAADAQITHSFGDRAHLRGAFLNKACF